MSTFDGIVAEFPNIRIDYFRSSPHQAPSKAPLAFFLSHVHSDHLVGLETCKAPFIYCSPATRDILLRLEKYHHRMNFARGIVEARRQTYRHLKTLLKAIPLDTPTEIQLAPSSSLRVTLIDANHCVGSVMFLIEGDGKAILYTGDIRAEPWWVTSLARHPVLMPYVVFGDSRGLDAIYLDTTFATKQDMHRDFPEKATGIQELLKKINKYPTDSLFYFDAWTFGYEDVWTTLAAFLGTQVHVDDYRYGLYRALANGVEPKAPEAPKLAGYSCGNYYQEGCLTRGFGRIHSCERGMGCDIWTKNFVRITPIVSRHHGVEIAELGTGGGHGDLRQRHDLEIRDISNIKQIMNLYSSNPMKGKFLEGNVRTILTNAVNEGLSSIPLDFSIRQDEIAGLETGEEGTIEVDNMRIDKFLLHLAELSGNKFKHPSACEADQSRIDNAKKSMEPSAPKHNNLPQRITFPYSRHSSYSELCAMIKLFRPKEIHPCTVDENNWTEASSMGFLFGHFYEHVTEFRHDRTMFKKCRARRQEDTGEFVPISALPMPQELNRDTSTPTTADYAKDENRHLSKRNKPEAGHLSGCSTFGPVDGGNAVRMALREDAYSAALGVGGRSWSDIDLISVKGHQTPEDEL